MQQHPSINIERKRLRTELRSRRRSLSPSQQKIAGCNLLKQLKCTSFFLRSRRIALYLPNDGEINTQPIVDWCWQQHKQIYLPVIYPLKTANLWFLPWYPKSMLKKNGFGILEPNLRSFAFANRNLRLYSLWHLDLVLLPLVGFDPMGNRLGMGGGFYDRALSALQQPRPHQPKLVGLAHQCQMVTKLPVQSWDIPLQCIGTDQHIYGIYPRNTSKYRP